jgi:hypothetical protein
VERTCAIPAPSPTRHPLPLGALLAFLVTCSPWYPPCAFVVAPSASDPRLGSGIPVGGGHLLTAAHLLHTSTVAFVRVGGHVHRAQPLVIDADADLALLRLDPRAGCRHGAVRLARRGRPAGTKVRLHAAAVAGIDRHLPWSTSGVLATEVLGCPGSLRALCQFADLTVGPGTSGAGAFDDQGRLVGVVIGMHRTMRLALLVAPETIRRVVLGADAYPDRKPRRDRFDNRAGTD